MTEEDKYSEPRAHELRERYVATFGGAELPVPVDAVAEVLLSYGRSRVRPLDLLVVKSFDEAV